MALRLNNLVILITLTLAGCGAMPNMALPTIKERTNYKGQPLSAVTSRLGWPNMEETIDGQKVYYWHVGMVTRECRIKVVMAGDVVDSYDTYGDSPACGPYEARAN